MYSCRQAVQACEANLKKEEEANLITYRNIYVLSLFG